MDNRTMLINAVKGEKRSIHYDIWYSVDCMGKITIWSGEETNAEIDFNVRVTTEDHIWLHPIGRKIWEMENERIVTNAELINEYRKFREQHPFDGWICETYKNKNLRFDRDDLEEMEIELKRRNRQYMKELFGVDIPLDFDFDKDFNERKGL
jgi:hypothetical protein